jgi:acyl carrier protein
MKTRDELLTIVKSALADTLNKKAGDLKEETRLVHDLAAESIDFLDIVSELEKEVDYEVDFKALMANSKNKNDVTVGEIVSHLEEKLNG